MMQKYLCKACFLCFLLIYFLIFTFLLPIAYIYMRILAKRNQQYIKHNREKFANYHNNIAYNKKYINKYILIHAASVGETMASVCLIDQIAKHLIAHCDHATEDIQNNQDHNINDNLAHQYRFFILISNNTFTGHEIAKKLFLKNEYLYGDKTPCIQLIYSPFDHPVVLNKFYSHFNIVLALIIETEIWPFTILIAKQLKIPVWLVNARLSPHAILRYQRLSCIFMPIFNQMERILCQNKNVKDNFTSLGVDILCEDYGNIKFDITVTQDQKILINQFGLMLGDNKFKKKLVIFASTRGEEEEICLLIAQQQKSTSDRFIFIIAPRHPKRFLYVESLLKKHNIQYQNKSSNQPIKSDTLVILGDSVGEMYAYYYHADIAVIGGSFNGYGGQNPIEPIYFAKPVIFGQSMYNFSLVANDILQFKCGIQLLSMEQCFAIMIQILNNKNNEYQQLVNGTYQFIDKYKGASKKIFNQIVKSIS